MAVPRSKHYKEGSQSGSSATKTISVGGQDRVVREGSLADQRYSAMPGAVSSSNAADISKANAAIKTRSTNNLNALRAAGEDRPMGEMTDFTTTDALSDPAQQRLGSEQAPQGMIDQVNSAAKTMGVTLQKQADGTYKTAPDQAAQYKQALGVMNQSGVDASQSAGMGSKMVEDAMKQVTGGTTEAASILGNVQETDNMFDSLFVALDEYLSPAKQKTSLLDDYKKLSNQLDIDDLNEEIIDTKRIIEGTEDDIRAEIQAAGGMGTESQVLALAQSRNKGLLKNYQALVDTKEAAMQQLTTMMNLSVQDRQFAEAELTRKLNFGMQVAQFTQSATQNARSNYWNLINNGMGSALLQDSNSVRTIEKTLGLPAGGLQQAVTSKATEMNNFGFMNVDGTVYRTDPKTGSVVSVAGGSDKTGVGGASEYVDQVKFLKTTAREALELAGAAGPSSITKLLGDTFVGDTDYRRLENKVNTLRTNMLTLASDPNIKKFFGPQMSNKDIELMLSSGSTLNADSQSPSDLKAELNRLLPIFDKLSAAQGGSSQNGVTITAPTGETILITDY